MKRARDGRRSTAGPPSGRGGFLSQCTEARHIQDEGFAANGVRFQAGAWPTLLENAARKEQSVSPHRTQAVHNAIRPCTDLPRRFPARAAVAESLPVRSFREYVGRQAATVFTIIQSKRSRSIRDTGPDDALQATGKNSARAELKSPLDSGTARLEIKLFTRGDLCPRKSLDLRSPQTP